MSPIDRPEDAIIKDDAKLDAWYKQFTRDQAREIGEARRAQKKRPPVPQDAPKITDVPWA